MLTYQDLYEYLRKEKYSEQLQKLPRDFITQFSGYCVEKKKQFSALEVGNDMFGDETLREKKQFENAVTLFKELMLRRKKKILNLVFIAAETGIMKKDFDDMLIFEKELFEKLVKAVDEGDKALSEMMNGKVEEDSGLKMIIMNDDVEQFVDMEGGLVGPFSKGSLVSLGVEIAKILVDDGKARFVDAS